MELPARFGRYVLEQKLGQGGMAEVFRARLDDELFQKPVCIKRIKPELAGEPGFADMLRDEARLAARLMHTNLVQALDFGSVDGTLYMAMELVDGATLAQAARAVRHAGDRFPIAKALQIAVSMCRGLHFAHTASANGKPLGFVHRDVSPQNVLLGVDGAVKIADFGVARATERVTRTSTGAIKGKPQYMAPEQANAERSDHRVDQFATGIVLWEILAGRDLFARGTVLSTLEAITDCRVPSLVDERDDVPQSVDDVVHRALEKDPARRFPDMRAFEKALDAELSVLGAKPSDLDIRPLVFHALEAGTAPAFYTRDATVDNEADAATVPGAAAQTASDLQPGDADGFESDVTVPTRAALGAESAVTTPHSLRDGALSALSLADQKSVWAPSPTSAPPVKGPPESSQPSSRPAPVESSRPSSRPAPVESSRPSSRPPPAPTPSMPKVPKKLMWFVASGAGFVLTAGLLLVVTRDPAVDPQQPLQQKESARAPSAADEPGDRAAPEPPDGAKGPAEPARAPPPLQPALGEPPPSKEAIGATSGRAAGGPFVSKSDAMPHPKSLAEAVREAKKALLADDANVVIQVLAPYAHGNDAQTHRILGIAYGKLQMNELSREHYRRYLELAPNAPDKDLVWKILAGTSSAKP